MLAALVYRSVGKGWTSLMQKALNNYSDASFLSVASQCLTVLVVPF
jgi:hypothetical protein